MGIIQDYGDKFRATMNDGSELIIKCKSGGHVYAYSDTAFGVWLNTGRPKATFDAMRKNFPALIQEQVGQGEMVCTFTPRDKKEGIRFLRSVKAHKRREYDPAVLERLKESGQNLQRLHPGGGAGGESLRKAGE